MKKNKLNAESLKVESFDTSASPTQFGDTAVDAGNCICFAPPCICSAGPDCTQ